MKLSFSYLNNLFNTYYVSEWCMFEYCCRGEDYNCWIDVESSWIRLGEKMTDKEYNDKIYRSIKGSINEKLTKQQIGKRSVFIDENARKNSIVVCIPLRDVAKYDHWIVFDKNHLI